MTFRMSTGLLVVLVAAILFAGTVNGIAGFGFALIATMVLAIVIDPATAVVFMILPILGVNLSLARELSTTDFRTCERRFRPLLVPALFGAVVGMIVLERIPADPLRVGLGLITLGFVISSQNLVAIPGSQSVTDRCFAETKPAMVGIGAVSGLLFGATNVGVQLVAYLKSCNLPHGLFVSIIGLVFVGLNGVRVVAAGALGLYPTVEFVGASALAVVPATVGVILGSRLRSIIPEQWREGLVLLLLTAIGIRLVSIGF